MGLVTNSSCPVLWSSIVHAWLKPSWDSNWIYQFMCIRSLYIRVTILSYPEWHVEEREWVPSFNHMKKRVVKCPPTGPEGSSTHRTTFWRYLTTLLEFTSWIANFICNASTQPTQETADMSSLNEGQEDEKGPTVGPLWWGHWGGRREE